MYSEKDGALKNGNNDDSERSYVEWPRKWRGVNDSKKRAMETKGKETYKEEEVT